VSEYFDMEILEGGGSSRAQTLLYHASF